MKIVFLCRLFYPHIGGVEKHVMEVGKRLVKQGHKVVVITEKLPNTPVSEEKEGISIYRIAAGKENWFKKFRIWKALWQKRKLLEQANVVHCHDVFFWYLPFRFLFPTKPVYTTFHGYETKFPPAKKAIIIRKLSEKLSWGNICIGDFIKKWYGTKPTLVSYGGADLVKDSKFRVQTYNANLKIVFVGRLEKDTGLPIYLKALEILRRQKIAFTFDAYGDGSLRKDVEKYAAVHGFTENISSVIHNADIVFASSYLSILESFASKKLVVSVYDNPLKKEYLMMAPFAKWIIAADSPERLVKELSLSLSRPEKQEETISNAYQWSKKQTWDDVANVYKKLWRV